VPPKTGNGSGAYADNGSGLDPTGGKVRVGAVLFAVGTPAAAGPAGTQGVANDGGHRAQKDGDVTGQRPVLDVPVVEASRSEMEVAPRRPWTWAQPVKPTGTRRRAS